MTPEELEAIRAIVREEVRAAIKEMIPVDAEADDALSYKQVALQLSVTRKPERKPLQAGDIANWVQLGLLRATRLGEAQPRVSVADFHFFREWTRHTAEDREEDRRAEQEAEWRKRHPVSEVKSFAPIKPRTKPR